MKKSLIIIPLLLLLAGIGLYMWIIQIFEGFYVTGLNNSVIWGLYAVGIIFFVGASAGGLIVHSSYHAFGAKPYKPFTRLGLISALACIILVFAYEFPDLGRVERFYYIFVYPNITSPFIVSVATYIIYATLLVIELFYMRYGGERDPTLAKALAIIGIPVAVLIHSTTAWVFGLIQARAIWFTALMAPIFLSSALVSGLGLMILSAYLLNKVYGRELYTSEDFKTLGKFLFVLMPIDAFLLLCEILTTMYASKPYEMAALNYLLFGPLAKSFWFEIIVGIGVAYLLLLYSLLKRSVKGMVIASVLVIVGIWLKRFNLVVVGQVFTPELAYTVGAYVPTMVEWAISIGWLAFGILVFFALLLFIERIPGGLLGEEHESK